MNEIVIPEYTKRDFLATTAPFEWLYQYRNNKLQMKQLISRMSEKAGSVGVRNFVSLYKAYLEMMSSKDGLIADNTTDFTDQPMELDCGSWYCDDLGITGTDKLGFEIVACNHPIMPVQRLINIDSGVEKLKLAYRKNKQWRYIISDKRTLASNNSILQLADYGVAVNSENAKYLVRYLTDIEHLNYEKIEELNSVGRLGWIDNYGFSPYVEDLVFDGDLSFKHFFESVKEHGSYEKWLDVAKEIRCGGICARLMLVSSFASVLVKPCGALPFFVHLWGGTETGKTVGLMLAASVWANPKMGEYIHTFNSTSVAQELAATFVNSMPLILDELQIIKERKDFDNIIYMLSEGVGRNRGQKTGGLQKIGSWQNCILTTGEMPINNGASGGGAVNRIIEVDCKDIHLFDNPVHIADVIKHNYGFAGRKFVEKLMEQENIDYAVRTQKEFYKELSRGETTEKQAMAASVILAADKLTDEWIFHDGNTLSVKDIEPFLSTKRDVSVNERALEFLYEYISINQHRFRNDEYSEVWGAMDDAYTYIIKAQFDKIMKEEGYNPTAFLSWAKQRDYITCAQNRTTKSKRIQQKTCHCVWLKNVINMEDMTDEQRESFPFDLKSL